MGEGEKIKWIDNIGNVENEKKGGEGKPTNVLAVSWLLKYNYINIKVLISGE